MTINELADTVIRLAGGGASRRLVPYEKVYGPDFEDPAHRLPDVTRIREAIGFERRYTLEQTLSELIDLCREQAGGLAAVGGDG